MAQNYPNPFNAQIKITFSLPNASDVSLRIYNLFGQRIATLVDEDLDAGRHTITWDASQYSSGIYFYRLTARQGPGRSTTGDIVFTKKMTLLK